MKMQDAISWHLVKYRGTLGVDKDDGVCVPHFMD